MGQLAASPKTSRDWAFQLVGGFSTLGLMLTMMSAYGGVEGAGGARGVVAATQSALVSGASLFAGGFLGFLFGMPRTPGSSGASDPGGNGDAGVVYRPNTNLEQISDWLTKILVGVGLTQLSALPDRLNALAAYVAPIFAGSRAMGMAVLVYFAIAGFLIGFLWTRLYLVKFLRDADVVEKLEDTRKQMDELQRERDSEEQALSLADKQLSLDAPEVGADALIEALSNAPIAARRKVFYRAAQLRTTTWRDPATKPLMERTIPIFRALIAVDPDYHRNYGQLGFALKDCRMPHWQEALDAISKAIELRDGSPDARSDEWRWYEYVRAQCRIELDPAFKNGQKSTQAAIDLISADIAAAAASLGQTVRDDVQIGAWAAMNGINLAQLTRGG